MKNYPLNLVQESKFTICYLVVKKSDTDGYTQKALPRVGAFKNKIFSNRNIVLKGITITNVPNLYFPIKIYFQVFWSNFLFLCSQKL